VAAAARGASRLRPGDGSTVALREEDAQGSGDVQAAAFAARDRGVGVLHRTEGVEPVAAVEAGVFVDRHTHNSNGREGEGQLAAD
jgi:hypothetical protein